MLNRLAVSFLALAMTVCASAGAWAAERFALVIGNSKYETIGILPNPTKDADAVTGFLDSAGFEVTSALDLGREDMTRAVRDFAGKLADKGEDSVALIYFAGHGLQIDGANYLLPVDADISRESDVALEAVRLADVMNMLDTIASKTRIVILDACRNNPFEDINEAGRGLAIVNAPAGTIVAYSTSPGTVAADGAGDNSPFTASLIKAAAKPGAAIGAVFQNTRLAVHKETKGRQTPWEVTALTEPFHFFPGEAGEGIEPVPEKTDAVWTEELRGYSPQDAYDVVVQQNNVIVYQIFLTLYPDSFWGLRIRAIMERRLEMLAWFDAITLNSPAAFEAFLKRYPDSDLVATAKRLAERAAQRALLAGQSPIAGAIAPKPVVKTVFKTKEVKVPFEVIREVKVPVIKEVVRVKEVRVPVEVIKEVRIPVVKEIVKIKEVRVPVIKEVIRVKKVPVIKEVVRIKRVKVPVVKIKHVRVPCKCGTPSGPSRIQSSSPQIRTQNIRRIR